MERAQIDSMIEAGVQIERYHKPHWSHLGRLNNRTHRKLLVTDGQLGFTGGVGIAENGRVMHEVKTNGAIVIIK